MFLIKLFQPCSLAAAAILLHALSTSPAFGHGFGIYLDGNKIQSLSQNSTVLDDRLYNANLDASLQTASSVEIIVGSGFEVPGDEFSIRLFGPLWYSTGDAATLAAADVVLAIDSYSDRFQTALLGTTTRTALSNTVVELPVPGNDHDSMFWTLSGGSLPAGVYGVSYIVEGLKGGDPLAPFQASDPLVITLRTPGFAADSPETLSDARLAVFEAAIVPEPASAVLALGAAALALLARGGWKRARRVKWGTNLGCVAKRPHGD